MKLSFTTLGCPQWTLKQIIEKAEKMGYDAVDFRGLLEDIDISHRPEFTTQLKTTKKLFRAHGIDVSAISISAHFAVVDPAEKEKQFDEAQRNLELASKLDSHVMRIYGGQVPKGYSIETIMPFLVENLRKIGDEAEKYDVTLALETHDAWTNSAVLARVIDQVNHPRVRVLWDLHHPYRFNGEKPELTYANLGKFTVGTHVKDSVLDKDGKPRYVLLGEGTVPIKRMLEMLVQGGYSGYATLEWEKRWLPELAEPEDIFPQYAQKMREWMGK
jgi:sugar phosphate isomerase/epimerase